MAIFPGKKIFMAIHKIKDVKLKWLQIRIVHRILGTNVVLNAMGLMNTTNCGFCNGVRDSIDHFFWNCEHIQSFWDGLEKLVNEKCDHASNVKITCNLVLFGVDNKLKTDKVFDFIIIFAKSYIYRCKLEKCMPSLLSFQKQLNSRFKIEKYNAIINDHLSTFEADWHYYKPLLHV